MSWDNQKESLSQKANDYIFKSKWSQKTRERIWSENGIFPDQRADFNSTKKKCPETTLMYVNQGTISTVKNNLAIYIIFFYSRTSHTSSKLSSRCWSLQMETKHNKTQCAITWYVDWKISWLRLSLAYIILRDDSEEVYFNYSFSAKKTKALFFTFKDKTSNTFMCTAFKRHYNTIFDKHCTKMSGIFLYFSNNMDKKESINQCKDNVSLKKIFP